MGRPCADCACELPETSSPLRLVCSDCRRQRVRGGPTRFSDEQKKYILENDGHMTVRAMAAHLGASTSSVSKVRHAAGRVKSQLIPVHLREGALRAYEEYGLKRAQEMFPDVRVASLVQRYPHKAKFWRWGDDDSVELVRMAGLVPFVDQAMFLNRPTRGRPGMMIWSRWIKIMEGVHKARGGSQTIHGMSYYLAKYICRKGAPRFFMPYQQPFSRSRKSFGAPHSGVNRSIILWCDMERWMLPEAPEPIRESIACLAGFQRWLFATDDPRAAIDAIVLDRTGAAARAMDSDATRHVVA